MTQSSCCFADKSATNKNYYYYYNNEAAIGTLCGTCQKLGNYFAFTVHTTTPLSQKNKFKIKACMESELAKWIVNSGQSTLHTKHNMKHSGLAKMYLMAKEELWRL
jgi:hypothetical protein